MRWLVGALCVSLLVACGGSNKPVANESPPEAPQATVDKAVAMFLEIGRVVMEAKSDCDAMATNVGAWLDANGKKRTELNARLVKIRTTELEERYRAGLNAHLDVIMAVKAGVEGCQQHQGFAKTWKRLGR